MAGDLLAAILAGQDPMSPQMLKGYQGAQQTQAVLDPSLWENSGPFGALARTLMSFRGNDAMRGAVADTSAARAAARPDLASAMSNPSGPLLYAQQHPEMGQVPLAQILAIPPGEVQNYIEAARVGRANAPGAAPMVNTTPAESAVQLPGWGKLNAGAPAPARGDVSALGNGRYPQAAQAEPQAAPPAAVEVSQAAAVSPQQRAQMLQNPQQRAIILQQLRQMAMQRAKIGGTGAAGR